MLIEKFINSVSNENEDYGRHNWRNHYGPIVLIVLIKLILMYIVMIMWPKVMPKIMPGITKNPSYINLIGLSVILSIL